MARGVKALDFTSRDGQRHYQVTRTDGQPVDADDWIEELRIPEEARERLVTAGWEDEAIPGWWHRLFVWQEAKHE